MIFYDCPTAPSPRRARMFIAEKAMDIETRQIDLAAGEQLGGGFLAVNPRGTVPVLVTDDGVALTENLAIAAYLEAVSPEPALMGGSPGGKAEILMWNAICETQGLQAVADALRNSSPRLKGRALTGPVDFEQIPALAERGAARVDIFFKTLDERLAGRGWLVGESLSLADITAFVTCDFCRAIKKRVDEDTPSLKAWFDAMKERPSASL